MSDPKETEAKPLAVEETQSAEEAVELAEVEVVPAVDDANAEGEEEDESDLEDEEEENEDEDEDEDEDEEEDEDDKPEGSEGAEREGA